jgi:regulator of protease activity HflC (stomatin/prohibitin superfamily)
MQRAMAKQAEAERERRSKVINAEGEFQAAQKLKEAAQTIQDFLLHCNFVICKRLPTLH